MPTYQYACTECGDELEVQQSFSDDPLTECPACKGRLRKVYNAVGVVFKGSGFYRTDSRKDASTGKSSGKSSGDSATTPSPAKSSSDSSTSSTKPSTASSASSAAS